MPSLLKDMRVYHGGGNVIMPQKSLYGSDICSPLKQMGCKTVPKRMCADSFCQPGFASSRLDGFINDTGINMVATSNTASRVYGKRTGGENVLPAPFSGGIGVFSSQGIGHLNFAIPIGQIIFMDAFHFG